MRALFPEIALLQLAGHNEAVPLAHVLELAALGLQAQAGCPVTFSHTKATVEPGVYQVVVEYSEEAVGRKAFDLAQQLCHAALHDSGFDLAAALAELRELDEDERLGPSTGSIVQAAVARGIPFRRLTRGSLVQFGWGSKQRRIQAAETDRSSAIAESIAQDKELTKKLLAAAGVPVPDGRPVTSADDAWAALCEISPPVVVKPVDGNQGKGVTVNIVTRDELERRLCRSDQDQFGCVGGTLYSRQRFSFAGGGRQAGRRCAPRPAAGDRRWCAQRARTGRAGEQRSAPRRRTCHFLDQDPFRRDRPGQSGGTGIAVPIRYRARAHLCGCATMPT